MNLYKMQTNFDEIWLLFSRNFRGRSAIFRPKFQSSNTGQKFANLTTKLRLEFIRTETKIQEPN